MLRNLPYAGRRVRQTLVDFDNGFSLLASMGRARLTGRPDELTYRLDGSTSVTCPNVAGARMPIYEVFLDDTYRLGWFLRGVGPAPVAVDIGAHIGSFALAFVRNHPDGRVEAYEASPSTASYLERNIAANSASEQVHAHQVAVAAETGTLEFADNGAGSIHNGITSFQETTAITVDAVSIADVFARIGGPVDLVKIDAEGGEYDFVLGSQPQDWAPVQRVVMEYHDRPGFSWSQLEDFFAEAGLSLVEQAPVNDRLGLAWLARGPVA